MKNLLLILVLFVGNVFSETLKVDCGKSYDSEIIINSDNKTVYAPHFGTLKYKFKNNILYFERKFPEWAGRKESFEFDNKKLILKKTFWRGAPRQGFPWEVQYETTYQCKWVEFRR